MLNSRPSGHHAKTAHALAQQQHAHHSQRYNHYRHWEEQNAALTASDAAKAERDEQKIFEQGRELKKREAEFRKKLDACKQGDQLCHRKVISEEIRQQKLRAMAKKHHSHGMEVTDAMGRTMPMLFNGHPEPFHKSHAAKTTVTSLLFIAALTGLVL